MSWLHHVAIWGALTGTVSVLLQIRAFWRDRPRIMIRARLGSEGRRFEVIAVNIGRRPVYSESLMVEYQLRPKGPRFIEEFRQESTQLELDEGEGANFYLGDFGDWAGDNYELVYRVGLLDKTGRTWWSMRRIGEKLAIAKDEGYVLEEYKTDNSHLALFKVRFGYIVLYFGEPEVCKRYFLQWRAAKAFDRMKRKYLGQAVV
jgi:hypothetical protein